MIPSITLLVVVVVLIGCCSAQPFKESLGECKNKQFDHSTYGPCRIHHARHKSGRLCEVEGQCYTEKVEVCPKDAKVGRYTKWEVDFVDAPNHYVCIARQQKDNYGWTFFVCFYDRIDTNQKWWCVYSMKVNDYQQSTENTIDFKTIEIKIDNHVGNKYSICKPTTFLALTKCDGNKASVISYCNSSNPALVSAQVKKLGNDFCSVGEPSSKECEWSDWTGVGRCERRLNNTYCSKTAVRHQISQDRHAPLKSCNATEDRLEECRCDLDCMMSERIGQPCSPSQLPNGRLSCKRNLTRTIQINQAGNGAGCGELSKQQECKKNDSDAME